jgi:hypothetical protein
MGGTTAITTSTMITHRSQNRHSGSGASGSGGAQSMT